LSAPSAHKPRRPGLRSLVMVLCGAKEDKAVKAARRHSLTLARKIEADGRRYSMVKKLLLLGAGESGKSTVFKQMRIIHASGYSTSELQQFKAIIHRNVLDGIRILVEQANAKDIELEEHNEELADQVLLWDADNLNPEMADVIARLWEDPGIQQCVSRRAEFQIADGILSFLADIRRIGAANYSPTMDDALRARVRTSGVVMKDFVIKGEPYQMYDVGGQRSERRKWLPLFNNVTAVVFVAAISEYDQVVAEDRSKNRLQEALDLFKQVVNSKHFDDAFIILFLNKKDLFAEKIKKVDPRKWFPDYTGGCDYDKAEAYFTEQFRKRVLCEEKQNFTYVYTTCATDTKNIEVVFQAMQQTMFARLTDAAIG